MRTGLGALAPSHLVVHPVHGPWLALRAVFVVPGKRAAAGPEVWRAWLAVRDACTLRDHRYDEEQIRYHDTRAWPTRV